MKRGVSIKKRGDTSHMLLHIKELIESTQASHTHLALQLIEGGGVASAFLGHLLALSKWYPDPSVRTQAKELFYQFASRELVTYVNKRWSKQYSDEFDEVKISQQFEELSAFTEIEVEDLAWMSLKLRRKGGKYCLEHQTVATEVILKEIKSGTSLFLCNYGLKALPREIGILKDLTVLNISGNHFSTLPNELFQLTQLEKIYFTRTPISAKSIKKLEKAFPKVFAEKYYYQAYDFKHEEAYLKAFMMYQRAALLDPDFAETWHQAGLCLLKLNRTQAAEVFLEQGSKTYQAILKKDPQNAYYWYSLAILAAQQQNTATLLTCLKNAIQFNPHYQSLAKEEEELVPYHHLTAFQQLIFKK